MELHADHPGPSGRSRDRLDWCRRLVEVENTMRRSRSVASIGLLLILALGQARAEDGIDPASQTYDCGTMALYHLLRLEGRPISRRSSDACLSRKKAVFR